MIDNDDKANNLRLAAIHAGVRKMDNMGDADLFSVYQALEFTFNKVADSLVLGEPLPQVPAAALDLMVDVTEVVYKAVLDAGVSPLLVILPWDVALHTLKEMRNA